MITCGIVFFGVHLHENVNSTKALHQVKAAGALSFCLGVVTSG